MRWLLLNGESIHTFDVKTVTEAIIAAKQLVEKVPARMEKFPYPAGFKELPPDAILFHEQCRWIKE